MTAEGATQTLGVALSAAPTSTVVIVVSSVDVATLYSLTTTITFTTTNFATKQYIQIVAPTDVDTTDDTSTVVLSIYPLLSAPEYALVAS